MAFTKINAAGIGTTETVTVDGLTVINNGSFGGNLSVGGTLTYEDVTNVDSVGLITARNGIVVGSGITLSKDGDIFATGVTTTGSLVSSGAISGTTGTFSGAISGTTGTFTGDVDIADKIVHTGDTDTAIRFSGADTIQFETGGSSRLQINSSGHTVAGGDLFADADLYMVDYLKHTGDTNTSIRFPAADTVTVETDGTERYRITSDGKFVGGPLANGHSTARCATGGLDLRAGQGGAGFPSLKIGADSGTTNATTLSTNTRKQARIGCASYHNSYDFATFLYFDSDTSTNELNIGGGTGHGYAATNISLWTAANNTTSTGTERMRVHSNGVASFNNGIELGSGLDATAANTMDDYEEGTFSPQYSGDSGAGNYSYSRQAGIYTKIGNTVYYSFYITTNVVNANASGNLIITGLPFTSGSNNEHYQAASIGYYASWNNTYPSHALCDVNNTRIYIYKNHAASNITHAVPTDVTNNTSVIVSGHYHTP